MAIRKLRPVTPTQRFRTVADFSSPTLRGVYLQQTVLEGTCNKRVNGNRCGN